MRSSRNLRHLWRGAAPLAGCAFLFACVNIDARQSHIRAEPGVKTPAPMHEAPALPLAPQPSGQTSRPSGPAPHPAKPHSRDLPDKTNEAGPPAGDTVDPADSSTQCARRFSAFLARLSSELIKLSNSMPSLDDDGMFALSRRELATDLKEADDIAGVCQRDPKRSAGAWLVTAYLLAVTGRYTDSHRMYDRVFAASNHLDLIPTAAREPHQFLYETIGACRSAPLNLAVVVRAEFDRAGGQRKRGLERLAQLYKGPQCRDLPDLIDRFFTRRAAAQTIPRLF